MSSSDPGTGDVSSAAGPPSHASAKQGAEALALRGKPARVRRLNKKTVMVLFSAFIVAAIASIFWGLRNSTPQRTETPSPRVDHVLPPEGLARLPSDYTHLGPPIGELGRPVLRQEKEAGLPQLPERPTFTPNPEEDAARTRRLKEEQEADAAARAQVFAQLKQRSPSDSSKGLSDANTQSNAHAPPGNEQSTGAPSPAGDKGYGSSQEHKEHFLTGSADATDTRIYASGTMQTPRSSAQLMAGSVIPAALLTGINSDLPGEIVATVTQPVYDTVTGHTLLIPQGARLIGQYDSQVSYGQSRVLLAWTRLVMPNGHSIVLDRLPGADASGQAGLEDQVDWHVKRLASGALVSTLLSIGSELAIPDRNGSNGVLILATKQGLEDSLNQVGQEITRRNLDVQPTLRIRPGFVFNVMVAKDLVLEPYAGI